MLPLQVVTTTVTTTTKTRTTWAGVTFTTTTTKEGDTIAIKTTKTTQTNGKCPQCTRGTGFCWKKITASMTICTSYISTSPKACSGGAEDCSRGPPPPSTPPPAPPPTPKRTTTTATLKQTLPPVFSTTKSRRTVTRPTAPLTTSTLTRTTTTATTVVTTVATTPVVQASVGAVCASGYEAVTSKQDCALAAQQLGLASTLPRSMTNRNEAHRPGCFYYPGLGSVTYIYETGDPEGTAPDNSAYLCARKGVALVAATSTTAKETSATQPAQIPQPTSGTKRTTATAGLPNQPTTAKAPVAPSADPITSTTTVPLSSCPAGSTAQYNTRTAAVECVTTTTPPTTTIAARSKSTAAVGGWPAVGKESATNPSSDAGKHYSTSQTFAPGNTDSADQDDSGEGRTLAVIIGCVVAACVLTAAIAVAIRRNEQRRRHAGIAVIDGDVATQQTTDLFHNPMFTRSGTAAAVVADDGGEARIVDDFVIDDNSVCAFHPDPTQRHDNTAVSTPNVNAVCTTPPSADVSPAESKAHRTSTQRRTGMESTVHNTVYVSSGTGGGTHQPDDCLYAIPTESSGGGSTDEHSYETIWDPATGLPYEVPLDPATGLPYDVPLDPVTGLPYETPLDNSHAYKMMTGNGVHGKQGYDGNITNAGHYAEGYDSQLTAGVGYDGQLTDPDYAMLRSRAERSTQRRPANVSTVANTIYDSTGGTTHPPAQTTINAVYAVPMETGTDNGIYASPADGPTTPGADAPPMYGAVHDFQNQVRMTRSTHVVDDIAYVTTPHADSDGADYSESAGQQEGHVYADMYAQEAVNPHNLSNYIHVSAENPAVCASVRPRTEVPTSAGEGYVEDGPGNATRTSTATNAASHPPASGTDEYVPDDALQLQVKGLHERPADLATVFVDVQTGFLIPLDNAGSGVGDSGYTSELTSAGDVSTSPAHVADGSFIGPAQQAATGATEFDVGANSGALVETSIDKPAHTSTNRDVKRRISYVTATAVTGTGHATQPGTTSSGGMMKASGYIKENSLDRVGHAARTLRATALPPATEIPAMPSQAQLVRAWLQRRVTGAQTDKELRLCPEGHFCVRKSSSTADCVVLSLMGPASTVHHYQFKTVGGVVKIQPGRKSMVEPTLTFASHNECLDFYLANNVSTTGLAARPTVCIPLPDTTPSYHDDAPPTTSSGQNGSHRPSAKLSGGANLEAGAAIDC